MNKKLKMIDLFSGGGGFSYAAEKLVGGYETIQFVEIESYCQKVLKKHWPTVPIHNDIKTYKPELFSADVVCGGFPCTDISTAGKGLGITKETRSGLFYELMRVIRMVRPKYIVLENVAAILNNGLDIVLGELSEAGYDAEWAVISASSLGACHQRSRWWLVAYPNKRSSTSQEQSPTFDRNKQGLRFDDENMRNVTDSNSNGHQGRWAEVCNQNVAGENPQIIRPTNTGNFERQSNDESNQGQSRFDKNISGSSNAGKAISSKSEGVCELSKETNNDQGISGQNKYQKNKDRTLVSEGQSGVQLPQHRGLGSDKATSEVHSIRQRNDNSKNKRVDFQESNTTNTNNNGLSSSEKPTGTQKFDGGSKERKEIFVKFKGGSQSRNSRTVQQTSKWRNTKHLLNPNWKEYGVEPAICRDNDGPTSELLTNRANRLKLLGNGLVPQCAAIPLQRVLDLENESQT
tara:strand:- start:134 stop:1516 length:1383 start_codon:yes stop_codon:yes gene_type:complete